MNHYFEKYLCGISSQNLSKKICINYYNKYFWRPTWGKLGNLLKIENRNWKKDNSIRNLEDYLADTKRGECWHLVYTVGVYILMGFTLEAHIVNTIGNYYPIMIQRYTRGIVSDIINRRNAREEPTA